MVALLNTAAAFTKSSGWPTVEGLNTCLWKSPKKRDWVRRLLIAYMKPRVGENTTQAPILKQQEVKDA